MQQDQPFTAYVALESSYVSGKASTATKSPANDIAMSRQMVDHYMRFRDQMGIAADRRKRLKVVKSEGERFSRSQPRE
jgi:hypothetical protein